MKRILGLFLSLMFIFAIIPFSAFAADATIISGKNAVLFEDAEYVTFGSVRFDSVSDMEITATINVSGCDSSDGEIHINGTRVANLKNGENVINFKCSTLNNDSNEIRVYLGTGKGAYTDNSVYGSVNADDITVDSFVLNGAGLSAPESVKLYMPTASQAGTTAKTANYTEAVAIGDGWSQDTGLGGTTPGTPVSIGFLFSKPNTDGMFSIDTTQIKDGEQKALFYKDGAVVSEKNFVIDNTAPAIEFSAKNNAILSRLDKLTFTVNDITNVKYSAYLDSKSVTEVNLKKLSAGTHTFYVNAVDEQGNTASKMLNFKLIDKRYSVSFSDDSVTMYVLGEADVYSANLIKDIRMFENTAGVSGQDYLRSEDEVLVSFDNKAELVTKSVGNALPYQSFVVNTSGIKDDFVIVSYTGETGNGSDIALKAWNYTESKWDKIATVANGESISVKVPLKEYSYKKKMRINAMPDIVYNGSDTLIWNSDTQYYSRFEDLNDFYYAIANYTVEQYNAGNAGYYVHTGDLIDQSHVGADIANAEFNVASKAQKILDDAMVPNGVVSGNHDVLHTEADYGYYWKYFGEKRYKDFPWYGGSLNNNMHHYDLVSLGAYDFVFMYLGCYKENDPDTIAWANAVCQAYPNRNVVICTHEYLLPSGAYSSPRSQIIWDEIVVPNENVVMILCGHNEGVCDQKRQVGNSDRYVLEILADYQFSELGVGPQHVLNGCTCDGEGFVRIMTFNEASQLISTTYSPKASEFGKDSYNFFPSYSDSFVYDMDLIEANRSIKTTEFNVAYNGKLKGAIGEDDISLKGCEAFYADLGESGLSKIYVLNEYEIDYKEDKKAESTPAEAEKIIVSGFSNVSENFRMNESNVIPDADYIENILNLMPENVNKLYQTSGSNIVEKSVADDRAVTIRHEQGNNANWVTLANNVNKKVNLTEFNRIYFGVTADKSVKWNIYVNFTGGKSINFSQDKNVASLFGYVNKAPSDIQGTWNGYIELDEIISGEQNISSIYLVSATPGATVTFDYLFVGKSNAGKVRFVTDDTTAIAYEAKIGDKISLPGDAFKQGYTFDGWFTAKEGGEKVEDGVIAAKDVTTLYARFSKKNVTESIVATYNTEINLEKPAIGKIIFVIASITVMITFALILFFKIKNSPKKKEK